MTSPDAPPSPRRVRLTLTEESSLNVDGGRGWVEEHWSVHTNDGWVKLTQLIQRKSVGEISLVEVHRGQLPAGRQYHRTVTIEAPVGTQVMQRVRRSELTGEQQTTFVLRGEERLARPRSAEDTRRAVEAAALPPPSAEEKRENARRARALLTKLGDAPALPAAAAPPAAPAAPAPEGSPSLDDAPRRRRRPVELTRTSPPESDEQDDKEDIA